mgnify:CR=1 FL=1
MMQEDKTYSANSHGWVLNSSKLPILSKVNLSLVDAKAGDKVLLEVPKNKGRIILHLTQDLTFNEKGMREVSGVTVDADSYEFPLGYPQNFEWPSTTPLYGAIMRAGEVPINFSKEQWMLHTAQEAFKVLEVQPQKKLPFKDVLFYLRQNNMMPSDPADLSVGTRKPAKPKNGEKFTQEELDALSQKYLQWVCKRYRTHLESKASYIRLTGHLYSTLAYTEPSTIYGKADFETQVRIGEQSRRVVVFFPYLLISIIYFFKAFSIFHVLEEGAVPDAENAQALRPEDRELLRRAVTRTGRRR